VAELKQKKIGITNISTTNGTWLLAIWSRLDGQTLISPNERERIAQDAESEERFNGKNI
jgi:hypothetical protein